MSSTGDIVSTITARTIEAAAAVPANNNLTATRHYELATVAVTDAGTVSVSQTRWGPIDDLPGTASGNYIMPPDYGVTTALTDYWDLLATGKGKDTSAVDLAPTYDSIQTNGTGFARIKKDGNKLMIFLREVTINSVGQITYIGAEELVFDETVI